NSATLMTLSGDNSNGYAGTFTVALNGLPATTPAPAATPTATATETVPPTAAATPAECDGDCDGNGEVTVDELVQGVNIVLGDADLSACPQFDVDGNGSVTVDELIKGVAAVLNGCG
ncbi:MAG TPA: hypothetical protein VMT89_14915, partial [Candidatus Acidoferrales bacterium]|nr:hypothetical protein [Candidatus Acidoferrales bacterium]